MSPPVTLSWMTRTIIDDCKPRDPRGTCQCVLQLESQSRNLREGCVSKRTAPAAPALAPLPAQAAPMAKSLPSSQRPEHELQGFCLCMRTQPPPAGASAPRGGSPEGGAQRGVAVRAPSPLRCARQASARPSANLQCGDLCCHQSSKLDRSRHRHSACRLVGLGSVGDNEQGSRSNRSFCGHCVMSRCCHRGCRRVSSVLTARLGGRPSDDCARRASRRGSSRCHRCRHAGRRLSSTLAGRLRGRPCYCSAGCTNRRGSGHCRRRRRRTTEGARRTGPRDHRSAELRLLRAARHALEAVACRAMCRGGAG